MSLGEEYRQDRLADEGAIVGAIMSGIWVDIKGRRHKIADMSDSYINNCINFLKRGSGEYADAYIEAFENELERRAGNEQV